MFSTFTTKAASDTPINEKWGPRRNFYTKKKNILGKWDNAAGRCGDQNQSDGLASSMSATEAHSGHVKIVAIGCKCTD